MNQEVKKKWAAALRSGKYKQIFGSLFKYSDPTSCNCCTLGVLYGVYAEEHGMDMKHLVAIRKVGSDEWIDVRNKIQTWSNFNGAEKLNCPSSEGSTKLLNGSVVALNDAFRIPFTKMADLIEEQL